jgi:signal transduction histidine kinase
VSAAARERRRGRDGRGPFRLALRIYVVTVAAVLATAAALFLILALGRPRLDRPMSELERDLVHRVAERLGARWSDPAALQAELAAVRSELGLRAVVTRWDGLAAEPGQVDPGPASRDDAPLPSAEQRAALARGAALQLGAGPPGPGPHWVAAAVQVAGEPVGYVALAPAPPPGAPPGAPRGHPGAPPAHWLLPPELLALALVLVGVGVAAVLLGGSIARPLDRLARTAHAIGAGDLSARTGISRRDELGAVARALDEMADRVAGLLRAQTELIANVAHELRTPLSRIRVALDLADDGDPSVARASLAEIAEDLAELEALVSDVLAAARMELLSNTVAGGVTPPLHRAPLELAGVARQAVERLRHLHPARPVSLDCAAPVPPVLGDAVLLRRVLDNVLDNARKYSPSEAEIAVRLGVLGGSATVEVHDRGDGLSAADLARLFTPFFRADPSRARATGGVGLGLALSRRIAEAHGGTLTARSSPGEGTTLTLSLPALAGAAGEPTSAPGPARSPARSD